MATTFSDVCDPRGNATVAKFIANATVLSWVQQESKIAYLPMSLIWAQWLYEGVDVCNTSCSVCNNPGNVNDGTFKSSVCGGTGYTVPNCTSYPGFGYNSSGLGGAEMNANVYNSQYCEVSGAYQNQISLTPGGQELYNYAQSNGWPVLSYGTYNALYQLGDYSPVWASSKYTSDYIGAPYASDVPGSGLVYLIWFNNLEKYDEQYVG